MNYEEEIKQLDLILGELKTLKSELVKTKAKSEKSFNANWQNSTPRQIDKAVTDLNWQCMHLDKQRIRTWKLIKDSSLKVNTDETEYHPSSFHSYKG